MIHRTLRLALIALALAAAPASAQEIHLGGSLGAGYSAAFAESLGATPWGYSEWDVLGSLDTSGVLLSERVLRWSGEVEYGTRQASLFRSRSIADRFTFGLNADAFSGTPFPVGVRASRTVADFTLGTGGPLALGSSRVNSYGLNAGYVGQNLLPSLRFGLSRSDVETQALNLATTRMSTTRLQLGASQSVGVFNYDANYDTAWNAGTRSDLQYQLHNFNLNAHAKLAPGTDLLLFENYYLRVPALEDVLNPRVDTNGAGATLQWRDGDKQSSTLGYHYAHSIVSAAALLDQASANHALNYTHSYQLDPTLLVQGNAGAQYGIARSGTAQLRGFGQNVGGAAWWKRPLYGLDTTIGGRASVGLVERRGQPLAVQWGAGTSLGAARSFGTFSGNVGYDLDYQRGGVTLLGWTLTQQLRADASTPLWERAIGTAGLFAGASRRTDAFLGSGFSRNVGLNASVRWSTYAARVSAGLYDGLAPTMGTPAIGDGLFLPPSYNAHTRYLTGSLNAAIVQGTLNFLLEGRLASIEGPGLPPQAEQAVTAMLYYTIGLVNLSLDYRYEMMSFSGRWSRSNTVFFRVTRSFRFL